MGLLLLIFGFFFIVLAAIEVWLRGHPLFTVILSIVVAIILVKNGAFDGT